MAILLTEAVWERTKKRHTNWVYLESLWFVLQARCLFGPPFWPKTKEKDTSFWRPFSATTGLSEYIQHIKNMHRTSKPIPRMFNMVGALTSAFRRISWALPARPCFHRHSSLWNCMLEIAYDHEESSQQHTSSQVLLYLDSNMLRLQSGKNEINSAKDALIQAKHDSTCTSKTEGACMHLSSTPSRPH